jgi:hypothetical protein
MYDEEINNDNFVNQKYPLILVFYLDRGLMSEPKIIGPFANYVDDLINKKNANIITFFIPTDGEERVECINPVQIEKPKMDKIMKMVDDISRNFFDINGNNGNL